jgi:hypothetical protein
MGPKKKDERFSNHSSTSVGICVRHLIHIYKLILWIGPAEDNCKEMNYELLNTITNHAAAHGNNVYMKGVAQTKPSTATAAAVFKEYVELSAAHPGFFGSAAMFEYFPLDKIQAVASDATAFRSRGPQANVLILSHWTGKNDEVRFAHAKKISQVLGGIVSGAEVEPKENENAGYGNYGALGLNSRRISFSHWLQTATRNQILSRCNAYSVTSRFLLTRFATTPHKSKSFSLPRLQQVKAKYDPENVFNKWFPIQPSA